MTRAQILDRICHAMVDAFELDPAAVRPEARLYEDLDLDSIDAVDLAVYIQQLTGHRVDEKSLRAARTVDDVVELVGRMLGGAS